TGGWRGGAGWCLVGGHGIKTPRVGWSRSRKEAPPPCQSGTCEQTGWRTIASVNLERCTTRSWFRSVLYLCRASLTLSYNWLRVFKIANTARLGRGGGQERWWRMGPSAKYVAR